MTGNPSGPMKLAENRLPRSLPHGRRQVARDQLTAPTGMNSWRVRSGGPEPPTDTSGRRPTRLRDTRLLQLQPQPVAADDRPARTDEGPVPCIKADNDRRRSTATNTRELQPKLQPRKRPLQCARSGVVGIPPVVDVQHHHGPALLVNAVPDAILAPACAPQSVERCTERSPDPARVSGERSGDELPRGERGCGREGVRQRATRPGCEDDGVRLTVHPSAVPPSGRPSLLR